MDEYRWLGTSTLSAYLLVFSLSRTHVELETLGVKYTADFI